MRVDLLDFILKIDPSFSKTLKDERYPYSQNIIGKRIQSKLNQKQFAMKIGIDFDTYLDLEECNLTVDLEVYLKISKRVDEI